MKTYLTEALFILFGFCFIYQLYYLIYYHFRLRAYRPPNRPDPINIPITVIISAHNEAVNLSENLPSILEQDYPDFEVIVVNDRSRDRTEDILKSIQTEYPRLKIVTVVENDRFKTGKKFALTMGIKAAKNEHLLFTDADCKPASVNWISRMAANFSGSTEIVLGYSPYYRGKKLLNAFIRFETIKTAINYLSMALAKNPYMGIGRNMAYTKTLFFSNKGFASHVHLMIGDDDLFVNENARANNTVIEIHPDSFMFSKAKNTFAALSKQKRRHIAVGKFYKSKHRRMLSFDALSGLLFYLLLAIYLVLDYDPLPALGLFLFRFLCQIFIYYKLFKKLDGKNLIWCLPLFDLIYYIYLNVFGFIGIFIKTTKWK